jgi:hypothetical protein
MTLRTIDARHAEGMSEAMHEFFSIAERLEDQFDTKRVIMRN